MPPRPGHGGIDGIDETTQPDTQPAGTVARPPGRFGVLLLVLIVTYLMSALSKGRLIDALQLVLYTGAALLALRNSLVSRTMVRLILAVAVIGTAVMLGLSLSPATGAMGEGIANLWTGLVLLFAVVVIVGRVLSFGTVTIQSIYGVLSAYLVIGLMFAALYAAIWRLGGQAFFANSQPNSTQTFQYFSFTTLTTLGYGDFTALHNGARAVAVLEALTGQIFLATLVARLVAAYRGPAERGR
jgi:ion channel